MAKATKPPSKTEIFASIAETTGLTKRDIGNVFAPWGQRVRSVGGVFIAPIGAFVAAFDPPEVPS